MKASTGEGFGPKTVRVEWLVIWSDLDKGTEHVCVRVRLDLNCGDSMCLPMPLREKGSREKGSKPFKGPTTVTTAEPIAGSRSWRTNNPDLQPANQIT